MFFCGQPHRVAAATLTGASAVGLWRTIDDKTHAPASLVETYIRDGKLCAHVKVVLKSSRGPHPTCERCSGSRKDQPVEGMEIMWDLSQDGDHWEGGSILDPANGTTYRCRVRLLGDDKLEVRGFVGISLFGRSQVWERVHSSPGAAQTP
ncbi:MAG: DUF2147 domain-containing protein [Cytophagaceae bacterium]|nr:MAG: DUF2147 domain-containing protein [Cytophagaceae bacterium]